MSGALIGSLIGSYRIVEILGKGGMGVVYRALDERTGEPVAVKTIGAMVPSRIHAIRREIQALNRIRHPGVVRILNHGVLEGRPWYAMDLLEGEDLRRWIERIWSPIHLRSYPGGTDELLTATETLPGNTAEEGPPPPGNEGLATSVGRGGDAKPPAAAGELPRALAVLQGLCETLSFLHGEGFVNCDLKPEHILLVRGRPVIIDFGLAAQDEGQSGRESLGATRGGPGTPSYMSPEQRQGALVDARSDLYAVGCILFELVTGQPPRTGGARLSSDFVSGTPPALDELISRLLSESFVDRVGYADEVATTLALVSGRPREPRDDLALPPSRPYIYRARFVGREDVLGRLDDLRERASEGRGSLVLIGGESGIGKTRLALELARVGARHRMRVVTSDMGMRPEDKVGLPLQALRPLLQAIAERCQEGGAEVTRQLLGGRRAVLAPYEPLLGALPRGEGEEEDDEGNAPLVLAPEAARKRLFRCLVETAVAFAQERGLLWLLDDVGKADELSLAFLNEIGKELPAGARLLAVATYRSEEARADLGALAAQPGVAHFTLPRLDPGAVNQMAADMLALKDPPHDFARFVEKQAEGNPFFVAEYLRAAVAEKVLVRARGQSWTVQAQHAWSQEGAPELLVPRPVRDLVERRIQALSPAGQRLALVSAVLGREADIDWLQAVAHLDDTAALNALDELLRRQVLETTGPRGVRFVHDKLREITYELALDEERAVLHLEAARTLERRLADHGDPSASWAVLGHHFAAGGAHAPAASYLKKAAEHARTIYANADALRLFREAIAQAKHTPDGAASDAPRTGLSMLALEEARGDVAALVGQRDEARTAYREALALAATTKSAAKAGADTSDGTAARVARARILRKLGRTWETPHEHEEELRLYDEAESVLLIDPQAATAPERDEWIQVRLDQLWARYWLNDVAAMNTLVAALAPVVSLHGSPVQKTRFYNTQTLRNLRRDRYAVADDTLALARAAMRASAASRPTAEWYMAKVTYGLVLLLHDALEEARAELEGALAYAKRAGDRAQQARCLTYLTLVARRAGRREEVERAVSESEVVARATGMKEYIAAAAANRAWLAWRQGDSAATLAFAEEALTGWKQLPGPFPFHWMAFVPRLQVAISLGDWDSAASAAEGMLATGQQRLPPTAETALRSALARARSDDSAHTQADFENARRVLTELRYG